MNAMLTFAPFLALVALLSVEVSAEILTHTELANFQDGFTSMSYTYTGGEAITVLPTAAGGCLGNAEACELPVGSNDADTKVTINAVVPPAAALVVPAGEGTPAQIIFRQCFSPQSVVGRGWRALNDPFKKDNSCKTGSADLDPVDYPAAGGPVTVSFPLGGKTPTAQVTIRAYVRCDNQIAADGDDQAKVFCHMVNYKTEAGDPVYYPTEVIDNRPAGLFTAVLICSFIGPLLLAAFLIYERGVLANKSK